MTATTELVVPRSIPMILLFVFRVLVWQNALAAFRFAVRAYRDTVIAVRGLECLGRNDYQI
jgi:hypothetical protein